MKHVYDYGTDKLSVLLAADKTSISDADVVTTARIQPDKTNRTILIGLGGTGCQTIHHVKRAVTSKLQPGWEEYVAFLAIDTDGNELNRMTLLKPEEKLMLTLDGVKDRATNPDDYPGHTWSLFADADMVKHITGFESHGAGRKRLMGKMKIHDKSLSKGVDEQIIDKLSGLKGNALAPFVPGDGGFYEVYVIGSVCGGTCSGGFLEMPAFIHKALNVNNVHVNAMLYLPDTVTALDPDNVAELEANGYASLKELNYFQGLHMRDGYSEKWTNNDPANPELVIESAKEFFEMPYLVGTKGGAAGDSLEIAKVTIAEFFVSILGQMTSTAAGQPPFLTQSFLSNAMVRRGDKHANVGINPEQELPGEDHAFPKDFGAIGFACASAPREILQAYVIGKACKEAGFQPVSPADKAVLIANGAKFLPFTAGDDYLTATNGTATAEQLLKPLLEFITRYQTQDFNMVEKLGNKKIEFNDIYNGEYDDGVLNDQIMNYVKSHTQPTNLQSLDGDIQAAYQTFKTNVHAYIMENGPFAFVNVFRGVFIKDNNGFGVGIRTMLENIRDGKDPVSGRIQGWQSAAAAKSEADEKKNEIKHNGGFWNKIGNVFNGRRTDLANEWEECMNRWGNRLFNEKQRDRVLGKNNALERYFLEPSMILAQQLEYFGNMLVELSEIYQTYGEKLEDFAAFTTVRENEASVNIAAVNTFAHAWLKGQAENVAQTVEGKRVRDAVVKSFFEHTEDWMAFGDHMVKDAAGGVVLANPDEPIPARKIFEKCMMDTIGMHVDVSIDNIFNSISANVSFDAFAQQIIKALCAASGLLFHGSVAANMYHRYVMYPSSLNASAPEIVTALQNAVNASNLGAVGFYCSDYTDSIMMYQLAAPFEIYRLNDLEQWERNYEVKIRTPSGLHGRSPDVVTTVDPAGHIQHQEGSSWKDYPSIVYRKDHAALDSLGRYKYREGEVRAHIDELLNEAKRMGILFVAQDAAGKYLYQRVFCNNPGSWDFDATLVAPDPDTGLLPTGQALLGEITRQNHTTPASLVRAVELLNGGLMNQPHATEEWAWYYAKRVLYVHRPMLIEIRQTVELFRKWYKTIDVYNAEIMKKFKAAKMIRIMQSDRLTDEGGFWKLEGSVVANLTEAGVTMLDFAKPQEAALVRAGLNLYYLFKKLEKTDLDPVLVRAKADFETWEGGGVIQDGITRTQKMMSEETAKITALGGVPGGAPARAFLDALMVAQINPNEAAGICEFYKNIQMWKFV